MQRINVLIGQPTFQEYIKKNTQAEINRIYCKHGFDHALDVARVAYIYLLEQGKNIPREIVYATGLLHDIGRWVEYQSGEDHASASASLAKPLLEESGFEGGEVEMILQGIKEHRKHQDQDISILGRAIALADDWARDCRSCVSKGECYKFSKEMLKLVY